MKKVLLSLILSSLIFVSKSQEIGLKGVNIGGYHFFMNQKTTTIVGGDYSISSVGLEDVIYEVKALSVNYKKARHVSQMELDKLLTAFKVKYGIEFQHKRKFDHIDVFHGKYKDCEFQIYAPNASPNESYLGKYTHVAIRIWNDKLKNELLEINRKRRAVQDKIDIGDI